MVKGNPVVVCDLDWPGKRFDRRRRNAVAARSGSLRHHGVRHRAWVDACGCCLTAWP